MSYIEEDFLNRKNQEFNSNQKEMTESEKSNAINFLKSKNLLKEIKNDLETLGYVGENANKILLYLCGTSRKQKKPLNILIRSQSSSGKSFLIDTICSLMPEEEVHAITSLSPQALYYMPEDGLKHKFIAIDEKHGADEAEYPIRSLQSGGKLSRAVPIKNPSTNLTETKYVTKEGPISYVDGSTDTSANPENANRCFEIYLDESDIQTKAVQNEQKKAYALESLSLDEIKSAIRTKHKNAQRLLKSIKVIIPYVYLIDFPCEWIRNRRDHDRFLSLISCITFLHQYQRETKFHGGDNSPLSPIPYIEATLYDYETAYKIASVVLFNTFRELEKPLFDFYLKLQDMTKELASENNIEPEEFWFTRKTIRENLKFEDYLLKKYMMQLKDLEYFVVKNSGNGSKDQYKLASTVNKEVMLKGLTTPEELRYKLNAKDITKKEEADLQ
ncbi:MAG: DnaG primase-like protein [uncultured bacterium]|nr:MAG: DnaG primase-like protein [uncultured bacterium]